MTKLAAYLPVMEELNPEDFADHDHSTEFTQYAVTASGIELGQAVKDHDEASEIVATLESIVESIEATDQLTTVDRVFIGHTIQSVQRRIGLVIRTPSMEANDEDSRQISMEGIAQGLAKLWEGTVALIRKILRGIRDFFAMIFGFGKRKEKRIKFQLAKAKEGGNDAAVSKIVEKNLLKHLEDVSSMQRILDNMVATPLEKERPDQLVLMTPATAQIIVRESDKPVDSSKPMMVNGQDVVAMRKKDVQALEHLTIGHAKQALITAMSVNGKLTFRSSTDTSVLMDHGDVNEMVWDTAFRGKEARDKGKLLAAELMKIATKAEAAITGGVKFDGTKTNVTRYVAEKTKDERAEVYKLFRNFVGTDDMMPMGSSIVVVKDHKPEFLQIAEFRGMPVVSTNVSKQLKIKFPKYGEVSKAADGIVTVTLLSNFNGSIDDTLKKFDDVLKVYERMQAWAITNAKNNPVLQRQITSITREMYDEPVKFFTSYIRAVGVMETIVIGWGDHITHPLSKLTDTKNLMKEIA